MGQLFRRQPLHDIGVLGYVLIPDEWGNYSDLEKMEDEMHDIVLIPDEWGNYSDAQKHEGGLVAAVLIPDEWGNYSDLYGK